MQIGLSLYGLSKAYYRIGDLENAIKSGSESLILLKKLGHFSADEVKNHLEALKAKNAG
jgi:hypothetical protein